MFERVLRWRKRSTDGKREERRGFGREVMGRSAKEKKLFGIRIVTTKT